MIKQMELTYSSQILIVSSYFEPININAVIPINVDNGFNHVDIKLYVKNAIQNREKKSLNSL